MSQTAAHAPSRKRNHLPGRGALLLCLALLAASGTGLGAAAQSGETTLTAAAPVAAEGLFEATAHEATTVLMRPSAGGGALSLLFEAASVRVDYNDGSWYCTVDSCHPTDGVQSSGGFTARLTNARATYERPNGDFLAIVSPEPDRIPSTDLTPHVARLAGDGPAALDVSEGERIMGGPSPAQPSPPAYAKPRGAFAVQALGGALESAGAHEVFFYNGVIHLTGTAEDGSAFDRRLTTGPVGSGDPLGYGERVAWLTLQTGEGTLTATTENPVETTSGQLTLLSRDGLLLEDASGTATTSTGTRSFDHEDARLTGEALVAPLEANPEGGADLLLTITAPPTVAANAPAPPGSPEGASLAAYAAGGAALLGAVGWFWPRLRYAGTLLALPLYTRISKGDALEHGKREEIYGLIRSEPGIHAHEISSRAGIGWGTTVYHLNLLENHGLVVSRRDGRYKRFFLAAGPRDAREAHAALRNETSANVARFVQANPGSTQKEMCQRLGIQPSLANWHIKRLETAGLVKKVKEGRLVRYFGGPAWAAIDSQAEPATAPHAATAQPEVGGVEG